MPRLPDSGRSLLVRTDFTDDAAWLRVKSAATASYDDGFTANVDPVDDRANEGVSPGALLAVLPDSDRGASVMFVVDSMTLISADAPILVLDVIQRRLHGTRLEPFRCVASELWAVDNNLNISNMDWEDFAENTDDDGVFRGF